MRILKDLQVIKIAFVDKPAVEDAKFLLLKAKGGAVPPHTTVKAPEGEAWNPSAAEQNELPDSAFAWIDPEYASGESDDKSKRKLPHHNKAGQVVWRAVAAAGAVLQGGRGGVDIPESDVAGVRRHLAGHYAQFEKEPPWSAEKSKGRRLVEFVKGLFPGDENGGEEIEKEGRKISSERLKRLKEAVEAMTAGAKAVAEIIAETDLVTQTEKEAAMTEDEKKELEDIKKRLEALEKDDGETQDEDTTETKKEEKAEDTKEEETPETAAKLDEVVKQAEEIKKAIKAVNEKVEKHLAQTTRTSKKTGADKEEKKESIFKDVF